MEFISPYSKNGDSYFTGLEWLNSLRDVDILYLFGNQKFPKDYLIPRGQDFTKKYEIVFSGCSETHGDYLTDNPDTYSGEDIWGFKVAKDLDKSAINLGLGGSSAYEIVKNILSYVTKDNKPSYIFCLFPDLNRLTLPNDPNVLVSKRYKKDKDIITTISTPIPDPNKQPKYSKKPHLKEEVIPKVVPAWLNLKSIAFLEKFCEIAGITLRYTTWSEQTHGFIDATTKLELKNSVGITYKNYVYSETMEWTKNDENSVCDRHKNSADKYFAAGKDGLHMGSHRHAHISEAILNSLTN